MKLTQRFKRLEPDERAQLLEQSRARETLRVVAESSLIASATQACDVAGVSVRDAVTAALREISNSSRVGSALLAVAAEIAHARGDVEAAGDIFEQIERARRDR